MKINRNDIKMSLVSSYCVSSQKFFVSDRELIKIIPRQSNPSKNICSPMATDGASRVQLKIEEMIVE